MCIDAGLYAVKGVSVWESFHPICQTMHIVQLEENGGGLGGCMHNDVFAKQDFSPCSSVLANCKW